jgi:hypothetical protein
MTDTLLQAVRRYTEAHADRDGVARTEVPGMTLVRTTGAGELLYAVQRPLICLVVQGVKQVTMGSSTLAFGAGDSLLITADVPPSARSPRPAAWPRTCPSPSTSIRR